MKDRVDCTRLLDLEVSVEPDLALNEGRFRARPLLRRGRRVGMQAQAIPKLTSSEVQMSGSTSMTRHFVSIKHTAKGSVVTELAGDTAARNDLGS